jgi:hypothetical protein
MHTIHTLHSYIVNKYIYTWHACMHTYTQTRTQGWHAHTARGTFLSTMQPKHTHIHAYIGGMRILRYMFIQS